MHRANSRPRESRQARPSLPSLRSGDLEAEADQYQRKAELDEVAGRVGVGHLRQVGGAGDQEYVGHLNSMIADDCILKPKKSAGSATLSEIRKIRAIRGGFHVAERL